jgi:hypothetical protein
MQEGKLGRSNFRWKLIVSNEGTYWVSKEERRREVLVEAEGD